MAHGELTTLLSGIIYRPVQPRLGRTEVNDQLTGEFDMTGCLTLIIFEGVRLGSPESPGVQYGDMGKWLHGQLC